MSDEQGLIEQIIEEPDEMSHRLVLADWLEDNGHDLRAQLIRVQCNLAGLLSMADVPFQVPGFLEIGSLQPALWGGLLDPFAGLAPFIGDPDTAPTAQILCSAFGFWLRRGLIEGLDIYGGQTAILFARDAGTITEQLPLRHLRFYPRSHRHGNEARSDYLRTHTLRALLDQPFVARLRTLDLAAQAVSEQAAACLLRYHDRLKLSRLVLNGPALSDKVRQDLREAFGQALDLAPPPDDDIPF